MGVIIPFVRTRGDGKPVTPVEPGATGFEVRLTVLTSSLEQYRRQIDQLETVVRTKCAHELDLLEKLHVKVTDLENELQRLRASSRRESLS